MKKLILLLIISLIYCKTNEELMRDFVKCAKDQVGKKFSTELGSRGPSVFNNPGLIWYCRIKAGFKKISTIYVSWKNVKKPKIGAYVEGVLKDDGKSISGDNLGVIVSLNPTTVVAGDPQKGVLTRHVLKPQKNYLRLEYIYLDL